MDFLSSKRFVTTALVFLVVLNAALLGVLWWKTMYRPEPARGFMGRQFRHENSFTAPLALSESQADTFQKLRQEHFVKVRPEIKVIDLLKKQLVREALNNTLDTAKIESLAKSIGAHQALIEREQALHFHELAKVCGPQQRDSLRTVLERIASHKRSGRRDRGGPPPPPPDR